MRQFAFSSPARAAIFLSGSGSNAERLLERWSADPKPPVDFAALVTDRPVRSRATEIGRRFNLPVIANDIRAFYRANGCQRVTIATDQGRRLRQLWTDALRQQLAPLNLDFGVFAGFVPLTNLAADLPCLNVHPGDLTVRRDGERYLVGLHTVPIERAILAGLDHLRTSVILVEPYTGKGDDMDNGALLGLSPKVPLDLQDTSTAELRAIAEARPARRPKGGFGDALEAVAEANQERLKEGGDWIVLPPTVWDFAAGRFRLDDAGEPLYRDGALWRPVETVEYDATRAAPRERPAGKESSHSC